jgi:hypothetical protein
MKTFFKKLKHTLNCRWFYGDPHSHSMPMMCVGYKGEKCFGCSCAVTEKK